ncbi:MAG: hypothetical protein LC754_03180 [Acidobacteria bacterium]|nr:hypothetical protein [Acidobacteriota bacterium]
MPTRFVLAHQDRQFIAQGTQAVAQGVRVTFEVCEARELLFDESLLLGDGGDGLVAPALPEGN